MLGKTGGDGPPLRERSEDLQVAWVVDELGCSCSWQLSCCLQPGSGYLPCYAQLVC